MNMRESFEKEYPVPDYIGWNSLEHGYDFKGADHMSRCEKLLTGLMDDLEDYKTKWGCWQKSRAAIVLPESTGGYIAGEYGNGYADALHEVKQAIGVDVP